jgi:hypothetical protein
LARWGRPDLTVVDPAGATWEIYVSRFRGPRWQPRDYESPSELMTWNWNLSGGVLLLLLEVPLFLYNCVLVPAATFLLRLPAAIVRSRRSETWTVEALCWWPHEQRFRWSVDAANRVRVAAEISQGIAEGRWAHPAGAVFHGEEIR